MTFGEVLTLGLVQGLTEFLPVSSSGHLVAARVLFGIKDIDGNSFDAFLHLGTLLAVLVYYWRVWWGMVRGIVMNDPEGKDKRDLAAKIALATVPAAVFGYLWQGSIESHFRTPVSVAAGLAVTAAVLASLDLAARRRSTIQRASFLDAVVVGLAQVAALAPGISRSGITIAAGRARGLSRKQAATFSFLLSAPIIAGAGLTSLSSLVMSSGFPVNQLLAGFIMSFLSGLLAIYILLKVVERVAFWPFAIYLFGLVAVLIFYG